MNTYQTFSEEHKGHTIEVVWHYDQDCEPPWEHEDGHGPVTDWTRRDKEPGEVVLVSDGHGRSKRFYNWQEATKIARRDGWDAPPYKTGTKGQRAERAVKADFEWLRKFCNDQWCWVGRVVSIDGKYLCQWSSKSFEDAKAKLLADIQRSKDIKPPEAEEVELWKVTQALQSLAPGVKIEPKVHYVYDDGGRSAAGFKGMASDCVCRAIAIATGYPYDTIYQEINRESCCERKTANKGLSHARTGVYKQTTKKLLNRFGWTWTPTMQIGSGCKVHLRADELPMGRLIVSVSKHMVAVIDGVIHDNHDCSRNGTRCVYGYWRRL